MKKLILLIFVSILLLTSCKEVSKLTEIKLPLSQIVTIPEIPIAGEATITTPGIKTKIDSVLNAAGISKNLIEDITLSKMAFVLTSPEGDFSFFKSVDIYLVAAGKADVKIAFAKDISKVSTLELKTLDTDIKDFILKDEFSLRIDFETKTPIESPKEIKINLEFLLDLKVLGL